jgi:BirA family biotin operon repressor/biotin-[acetyl-CoA-carboxylase] ligase
MLAGRVNFYAAAVLAETLREHLHIEAQVKWPNDILMGENKLCGLLAEMAAEGDQVQFVNIGIGINVNNRPPATEPPATSLKALVGGPVSRKQLLAAFLDRFEAGLAQATKAAVIERWKQCAATLERSVKVVTTRGTFHGEAVDVDEQGGLIIVQPDGTRRTIVYGDCFHQTPARNEAATIKDQPNKEK